VRYTKLFEDCETIHLRQKKVQQYQVDTRATGRFQTLRSVGCFHHFVSGDPKCVDDRATYRVLIFYDHDCSLFAHDFAPVLCIRTVVSSDASAHGDPGAHAPTRIVYPTRSSEEPFGTAGV